MRTIAHISDLHFGREDAAVAAGLVRDLRHLKPSLVVISGDLTQRARRSQFRAAAAYLQQLPQPQIVVPGNHDVPLYDVIRRFISPLGRYHLQITRNMYPFYNDGQIAVLGLNTARSATWKGGRISLSQIREVERILSGLPGALFKVVVTHHPFVPPPGDEAAAVDLVGRASQALEVLARCGVDLLLAGHLHHGYTGDIRNFYPTASRSIIAVQAGTAISHRIRHEPNAYNFITLRGRWIEIAIRRWGGGEFAEVERTSYRFKDEGWHVA
jgi:3',5'-cyclic AMP phosphodiesterase CpdA